MGRSGELSKRKSPWQRDRWVLALAALALAIGAAGCGGPEYAPLSTQASAVPAGSITVPPKVDILLVEDDTGSMDEMYPQVGNQLPDFLNNLDGRNWDFHFATIPLTTPAAVNQVAAGHYDGNWGSRWQAPFPGSPQNGPETIPSQYFRYPSKSDGSPYYTGFLSAPNNQGNGGEPGFSNMLNELAQLKNNSSGTNFFRNDALLVVLDVGNGDDTSLVNVCARLSGDLCGPCDQYVPSLPQCTDISQAGRSNPTCYTNPNHPDPSQNPSCASGTVTRQWFARQFQNLKAQPNQFQFYAAVANEQTSNCLGGSSRVGTRYQWMANQTAGQSYDVCTQQIAGVLDQLSTRLSPVTIGIRTHYLPISSQPDTSTIVVTKYSGGGATVLPQDPSNGWTYAGYVTNVDLIDYPVPTNQYTGYAIELHGSAKLVGSDRATVNYTAAGLQASH